MKGPGMWLATGWPSCCPHLHAATTPTLGPESLGSKLPTVGKGKQTGREQTALVLHSAHSGSSGQITDPQGSDLLSSFLNHSLSYLAKLDLICASLPSASCQASLLSWTLAWPLLTSPFLGLGLPQHFTHGHMAFACVFKAAIVISREGPLAFTRSIRTLQGLLSLGDQGSLSQSAGEQSTRSTENPERERVPCPNFMKPPAKAS